VSRILLAGESWTTTSTHTKGFDSFITSTYAEGGADFIAALEAVGHEVTYQPSHVAAEEFPATVEELSGYDAVVLSDIGANTLLLRAATFLRGEARPNPLLSLAQWVNGGGALLMVGGYLSFQGIEGKANYARSPLADVLPVFMETGDDRQESPQGVAPTLVQGAHPVIEGLDQTWPQILGFQRVVAKPAAQTLVDVDGHPLVVVGTAGQGRTMAFTSDMGPHWIPAEFIAWPGYARFWQQALAWLSERSATDPSAAESPAAAEQNQSGSTAEHRVLTS
jgi:uncharacterized membrane protein